MTRWRKPAGCRAGWWAIGEGRTVGYAAHGAAGMLTFVGATLYSTHHKTAPKRKA